MYKNAQDSKEKMIYMLSEDLILSHEYDTINSRPTKEKFYEIVLRIKKLKDRNEET